MSTITTRAGKGSPLTNNEVDANFENLNTDKAELSGAAFTGAITTTSTVDGRDVATDGTKLDGIEASADVTDTTNVTAAGALMDSEVTNLAQVKAFDSADYATAAQGTTADAALPKSGGAMTGAITTNSTFDGRDVATDGTKLDGIEALADVTDTANVTAAGALMDSELTSEASVKALNQGVATTDSPTFAAVTANGGVVVDNFTLDGTTLALSSGDMTLDAAGRIDLSADDSGEIRFFDGSSMYGQIKDDDDRLKIQGLISNKAMLLVGNDGGSEVTMLSLDAENAGAATFNSTIAATGIDVTGTATMDGLTSTTSSSMTQLTVNGTGAIESGINFANGGTTYGQIYFNNVSPYDMSVLQQYSTGSLIFGTNDTERMRIDASGNLIMTAGGSIVAGGANDLILNAGESGTPDIYLQSGGSTKVKIEGSNGSVGIGTSSPSTKLHLGGTAPLDSIIRQDSTVSGTNWEIGEREAGKWQIFEDDSDSVVATFMSSGSVGIGTSSPSSQLHISSTGATTATIEAGGGGDAVLDIKAAEASGGESIIRFSDSVSGVGFITYAQNDGGSDYMRFGTASTERMRIDSSGNLLVGKTSTSQTTAGTVLYSNGQVYATASGTQASVLTRLSSDGPIQIFYKDSSEVGRIGTVSGDMVVGTGDTGLRFYDAGRAIQPRHTDGTAANDVIDLGMSTNRFKDLYLSGSANIGGNINNYVPTNSGNPEFSIGSSATNRLFVQSVYNSGAQVLNYAVFRTFTSSSTANAGRIVFAVDEADKLEINDGGIAVTGGVSLGGNINATGVTTSVHAWKSTSDSTSASKHLIFANPNGNVGDIRTNTSSTSLSVNSIL